MHGQHTTAYAAQSGHVTVICERISKFKNGAWFRRAVHGIVDLRPCRDLFPSFGFAQNMAAMANRLAAPGTSEIDANGVIVSWIRSMSELAISGHIAVFGNPMLMSPSATSAAQNCCRATS
jgi:hypothetical protein